MAEPALIGTVTGDAERRPKNEFLLMPTIAAGLGHGEEISSVILFGRFGP
jgi:hypothetical protein